MFSSVHLYSIKTKWNIQIVTIRKFTPVFFKMGHQKLYLINTNTRIRLNILFNCRCPILENLAVVKILYLNLC